MTQLATRAVRTLAQAKAIITKQTRELDRARDQLARLLEAAPRPRRVGRRPASPPSR